MKRAMLYGAAAIAGIGVVVYMARKVQLPSVGSVAGNLAGGAVEAVNGAFVGSVKGIGSVFGVPDTSMSQCQKDIAAGRTWDASFSCPASDFVGSFFNSTNINAAEVNDARQIDRILEREAANNAAMDARYAGAAWGPSSSGYTGTW